MLVAISFVVVSCQGSHDNVQTIQFWHFWSEPAQRAVLDSLVRDYERKYPTIHIELTELSWSDGKSKLQMAFNAGTQPDVVHLGVDWYHEFARGGVFIDSAAIPWLVNARALVVNDRARRFTIGLCATDAHNVIKRVLPILWSHGAPSFYTSLPISATLDSSLVSALWNVRTLASNGALIERARQLDDRLLNDELHETYTGAWIIDMSRKRGIRHLRVVQTPSILNGDVLAIARKSQSEAVARDFITWLTSYENARSFALAVSDAGFPTDLERAATDAAFTSDPLQRGFLEVARKASPLPESDRILSIEPIIEDMIVRCYDAPSRADVERIITETRMQVQLLER